jgi:4-aminobutyrate aminotransferase-like enzyme/Ser/Thr protein kinase RdoA (MazF antagonist)
MDYQKITLSESHAEKWASDYFGKTGKASRLAGEIDFNFKITEASGQTYILKISRPDTDLAALDFQIGILDYLARQNPEVVYPKLVLSKNGQAVETAFDEAGALRHIRLLVWISGRLYATVNPQTDALRFSLGERCGEIAAILRGYHHAEAYRAFDWDVAQAAWTLSYLPLFDVERQATLQYFHNQFAAIQIAYSGLRKSIIHNDANDNNLLVSNDLKQPSVIALIDYGDAIYSQSINDVAVALAYAIMNQADPLAAAMPLVAGYHKTFALEEEELSVLYVLVAMRLVISVTKSAINKQREPENTYLQISDRPAWDLLRRWQRIHPQFAHFAFRYACGFSPVPIEEAFKNWAKTQDFSLQTLFPSLSFQAVLPMDLSIGSSFLGHYSVYQNDAAFTAKVAQHQLENPDTLLAGGYLEARALYSTQAYAKEGNNGTEYRTIHLGLDVWAAARTPVHAFMAGEVFGFADNRGNKDYGPTILLKHEFDDNTEGGVKAFYTLYGHLSVDSLAGLYIGKPIKTGDRIGYLGENEENGHWPPHLHFQILLDTLGNRSDFAGVGFPNERGIWSSICPDPNLLFKDATLTKTQIGQSDEDLINFRKAHLGKSLSLSYSSPLKILRGVKQYLIDADGRKYLDTVNNVAHIGHEHLAAVQAGQAQMAILNTNTRYLHPTIVAFATELLATFPPDLSVVHFVNSGSEANELALRMAEAVTNQRDMIALEIGYHGNTTGCIGISSYKFDGKGGRGKPEHTQILPLPDSFRGRHQGLLSETGAIYAAYVNEAIEAIQGKGRGVAGFIAESIVSCGGQIDLPDGYLQRVYAAVRAAGGVCIADEVQVGFGRVGHTFWGFEQQGVVPDIVTLGKPIGNGHPLAAVVCTRAVADAFANGMEYFNTFGGNPVSCAIGLSVLRTLKSEGLMENALVVGTYLKKALWAMSERFPIIGDVRGQGLFLGFELVEKGKIPAPAKAAYLADRMKEQGVLMSVDGPFNNVLKIKPPLCFSQADADLMLGYLEKILGEDFMLCIPHKF